LILDISDQGRGIAAADQKSVFEPFFSRKEKGLGLGLAMVRNLAVANRSRVELVHSSAEGSCFRLVLPAALAAGKESS
ncbi:MAG TPA: ATP-binding protein, partial [bacterium]|nr:ATP-binding protein [bacterium]